MTYALPIDSGAAILALAFQRYWTVNSPMVDSVVFQAKDLVVVVILKPKS